MAGMSNISVRSADPVLLLQVLADVFIVPVRALYEWLLRTGRATEVRD